MTTKKLARTLFGVISLELRGGLDEKGTLGDANAKEVRPTWRERKRTFAESTLKYPDLRVVSNCEDVVTARKVELYALARPEPRYWLSIDVESGGRAAPEHTGITYYDDSRLRRSWLSEHGIAGKQFIA
jgi:hypothetical protein